MTNDHRDNFENEFEEAPPPFEDDFSQDFPEGDDHEFDLQKPEEPSVANDGSLVASTPTRNLIVIGILLISSVVFLYNIVFSNDDKKAEQEAINKEIADKQPVSDAGLLPKDGASAELEFGQIQEPALPEIESLNKEAPPPLPPSLDSLDIALPKAVLEPEESIPTPPPLPTDVAPTATAPTLPTDVPAPPALGAQPGIPQVTGPTEAEILAALRAKRRAAMLVSNGGGSPTSSAELTGTDLTLTMNEVGNSTAPKSAVGKLNNTDYLIAQGKMIHSVLETAINTDLPGVLRAIVSRDVYAESGRSILVPKGSRLLGNYAAGIQRGQRRVLITWDRIILPNGLDIMIGSPGTDKLGRAGVRGMVDNKYFELFKNSFLLSALTIGTSLAFDGVSTNSNSRDPQGNETNTQSGKTSDLAVLDAVSEIGDISSKIAESLLDSKPTITVDQGTAINVFVNRDLIFPANAVSGNTKVIN